MQKYFVLLILSASLNTFAQKIDFATEQSEILMKLAQYEKRPYRMVKAKIFRHGKVVKTMLEYYDSVDNKIIFKHRIFTRETLLEELSFKTANWKLIAIKRDGKPYSVKIKNTWDRRQVVRFLLVINTFEQPKGLFLQRKINLT